MEKAPITLPSSVEQVALIVTGDISEAQAFARGVRQHGLVPLIVSNSEAATHLLAGWQPRLAIISLNNGERSRLIAKLRWRDIPVIAVGDIDDLGSDDGRLLGDPPGVQSMITVPLDPEELLVTVAAIVNATKNETISFPSRLTVDIRKGLAHADGIAIEIPPREFAVLVQLARAVGEPLTAEELARRAWPDDTLLTDQDIRRYVYRLRRILRLAGADDMIHTRRGFGYVLEPDSNGHARAAEKAGRPPMSALVAKRNGSS